jgi:hypothetical protein
MRKTINILFITAAILIILGAVFHMAFWYIFRWNTTLSGTTEINRNILYILNTLMILIFIGMAVISLFSRNELISTKTGKIILIWFALFWFLRVILEIILLKNNASIFIIILCSFLGFVYSLPLFYKLNKPEKN